MGFLDRFRKATVGRSKRYDRAAILALLQENERTAAPLSLREADLSEIDLSGLDAIEGNSKHDAFAWIGSKGFSGSAGELRVYRDHGQYALAGDTDGDEVADFTILVGRHQVSLGDLVLV